jgi:hypothetical protein
MQVPALISAERLLGGPFHSSADCGKADHEHWQVL